MKQIVLESVVIGIITALIGSIVVRIIISFNRIERNQSIDLEKTVDKLGQNYLLEISLFFTGILIHLILEYIGLNQWYCQKKCAGEGANKTCKLVCEKPL